MNKRVRGRPAPRGETASKMLQVKLTDDEYARYQSALRATETISTVTRALLDTWAKQRSEVSK